MKKAISLFAIMFFACSFNQGVNWMHGSLKAALDAAREQNRPVLVDFYSDT